MRRRYFAMVAVVVAGVLGTGCASISHVQTADTLGAGKFQFALEPGAGGAAVLTNVEGAEDGVYYPHVDLAVRYGVTDTVDLGVRFGSSLVELQGKFLLSRLDDTGKAISLAPALMGYSASSQGDRVSYVNVAVPVLIGLKTTGGSELVLGPRVVGTRVSLSSSDGTEGNFNVLSVGASVGYALRVGEGFRLLPEVGFTVPVVGAVDTNETDSDVVSGFGGGFVQFKLGFLFGQGRPISQAAPLGDMKAEGIRSEN